MAGLPDGLAVVVDSLTGAGQVHPFSGSVVSLKRNDTPSVALQSAVMQRGVVSVAEPSRPMLRRRAADGAVQACALDFSVRHPRLDYSNKASAAGQPSLRGALHSGLPCCRCLVGRTTGDLGSGESPRSGSALCLGRGPPRASWAPPQARSTFVLLFGLPRPQAGARRPTDSGGRADYFIFLFFLFFLFILFYFIYFFFFFFLFIFLDSSNRNLFIYLIIYWIYLNN